MNDAEFLSLMQGVYARDRDAIGDLWSGFIARMRTIAGDALAKHARLDVTVDDVVDEVFDHVTDSLGQRHVQLSSPEDFASYFAAACAHYLAAKGRHWTAQRRDVRRLAPVRVDEIDPPDPRPGPAQVAEWDEALEQIRRRLNPKDRYAFDERNNDVTWTTVAKVLGESADALRLRVQRKVAALIAELDLLPPPSQRPRTSR